MVPKYINIFNYKYRIIETECIAHGSNRIGEVDIIAQEIRIIKTLSDEHKLNTIIHEVLHAIFYYLGFTAEYENEHLINSLAHGLCNSILDDAFYRDWINVTISNK